MLDAKEAASLVLTEKEFVNTQVDLLLKNMEIRIRDACSRRIRRVDCAAFHKITKKASDKLERLGYTVKLEKAPDPNAPGKKSKHTILTITW